MLCNERIMSILEVKRDFFEIYKPFLCERSVVMVLCVFSLSFSLSFLEVLSRNGWEWIVLWNENCEVKRACFGNLYVLEI